MKPSWPFILYAILIAAVFSFLSHWVVFEYDIFWQLRAGKEIVETFSIQKIETWSHTANAQPWYNFQWLATVIVYLTTKWGGGIEALSTLRSFLVFIWMLGLVFFTRRGVERGVESKRVWLIPLILTPWVYLICWFRLQMRPDLFAICFYTGLLTLWFSRASSGLKKRASCLILLIWSNFHSGTVTLGIIVFSIFVFFETGLPKLNDLKSKLVWIALGVSTLFLTPQGFNVLEVLWQNVFAYDYALANNPDQQPFTLSLLDFYKGGWSLRLWVIYLLTAVLSYIVLWKTQKTLPIFYRNKSLVIVTALILTFLTFKKIRVIHYQAAFLLPIVSCGVVLFFEKLAIFLGKKRSQLSFLVLFVALGFFWGVAIPNQVQYVAKPIGRGLSAFDFPIESVSFIKKTRPRQNLLNYYSFGGYLIYELPEYPVAIDGREIPFLTFQRAWNEARQSTEGYSLFLKKFNINVVLETIPGMYYHPQAGMIDTQTLYYLQTDWALVFFDNVSVVYVRRIPEHASIIREFEYKAIRRGLPANYGASFQGLTDDVRALFEKEFDRCLSRHARNIYCIVGKAAFFEKYNQLSDAALFLDNAILFQPNSMEALVGRLSLANKMGDTKKVRTLEKMIESVGRPLVSGGQ